MASESRKKLSGKTIMGNVKAILREAGLKNGESIPAYQIGGIANDAERGDSNYGPYTAFKGEFGAQRLDKDSNPIGEMMESTTCFLPDEVVPSLYNAIFSKVIPARLGEGGILVEEEKRVAQPVTFAYTISIRVRDDLTIGYEYVCVNLKPATARRNPLAEALASMLGTQPTSGQVAASPPSNVAATQLEGKGKRR